MSTIPDDLNQLARELENIQEVMQTAVSDSPNYTKGDLKKAVLHFLSDVLDDAIKIISDAEERIVMLEARHDG